jgi:hypothetical protein
MTRTRVHPNATEENALFRVGGWLTYFSWAAVSSRARARELRARYGSQRPHSGPANQGGGLALLAGR